MRRKKKEKGRVNIFSAITIFQAYSNYFLHIGSLSLVNNFISFSATPIHIQLFVLSWTAVHEAPLSFTSSLSLLELMFMI